MKQVRTPFIIAPQGVITPTLLYDNFKTLTGKGEPLSKTQPIVLPVSSRLIDSIKEVAGSKIEQNSKLFSPSGIPVDIKPLQKPTFFLNEAQRKAVETASLQEVPPTPKLQYEKELMKLRD